MSNSQLLIAANTIWVVVAAVLVMFMQAGFAFLEAGLTRMKNAASLKLHHRVGFRVVGVRRSIGKRDGLWRDTVLMERRSEVIS